MSTESIVKKIHLFPSEESYETNQGSVGENDLSLVPINDYITGLSVSGTTITYTRKDGSSGTADVATGAGAEAYVIETWRNGNEWYRKWSDGFIEQGGFNTDNATVRTVTLHTPFIDSNYSLLFQQFGNEGSIEMMTNGTKAWATSTSAFSLRVYSSGVKFAWRAYGYYK